MSIKGNGGISGAGGSQKPEDAEELKRKQQDEQARAEQQRAGNEQSELTDGLTGRDRAHDCNCGCKGAGAGNGAGNGAGAGAGANGSGSLFGFGAGDAQMNNGFGFAGTFGSQSLDVDQEQLADLSNKFFNYTRACGDMPFGLGSYAMQNSIGNWFQAFMNCFKFTNTSTTVAGGANTNISASNGAGVGAGDGTKVADGAGDGNAPVAGAGNGAGNGNGTGAVPEGYTSTGTAGVYSKDGKYYHSVNGAMVECNADGSEIPSKVDNGAVKGKGKGHSASSAKRTSHSEAKHEPAKPKEKSEAELAKEGGYVKQKDGTYRKNGKHYRYDGNGGFDYVYSSKYKDGTMVRSGVVYAPNGDKAEKTPRSSSAQESVYTLEHYKNQDGWKTVSNNTGKTILESSDGRTTLYFDAGGKKIQENFKNSGFWRDGHTEVTRYAYNGDTGQLKSKETYNNQTGTSVKTEYLPQKGLKAGTSKSEKVQVQDEMDSNGRTTRRKEKIVVTTKVEMKGGIAVKTTTTQRVPVK